MEIYHVLSRGVDKRNIFLDDRDRFRFIHNMFEFNDLSIAKTSAHRQFNKQDDLRGRPVNQERRMSRKLLVDIHAFCLMPNHYHLLLSSKVEGGISKFMSKLNMGYAKYFNIKNDRTGALFESRYKSVPIERESHFMYLPQYIHLNPLDMHMPEWREKKLRNIKNAMDYLENYRWSSFLDYVGKKNFPSVTNRDFLLEVFGGTEKYKDKLGEYLQDLEGSRELSSNLLLE